MRFIIYVFNAGARPNTIRVDLLDLNLLDSIH